MIERLGNRLCPIAERCVPDPFVFAIGLTVLAGGLALGLTDATAGEVLGAWGKGFWELLAFGMQMCLVLVTGHALAASRPAAKAIALVAGLPARGSTAAALVAFVAAGTALLNWGLGLILGALLAREVALRGAERGRAFHYPLLAAAGYAGLMVWHGGLSGSAPLLVATKGHFLEEKIGILPVAQTLYSPLNLTICLVLVLLVTGLAALMHPSGVVKTAADFGVAAPVRARPPAPATIAEKLDRSRVFSLAAGGLGATYLIREGIASGFHLDLNVLNLAFLTAGLLAHESPRTYLDAVAEGARACAGIILQFPFYAGIMGIMKYTALMEVTATAIAGHVGPRTYPLLTFFSAGLANLFVPSGGGQWAVQGPLAVESAQRLGASLPRTLMAVAYGDEWTNMLQPFWALPLLGITRLRAGDIMGYTVLFMIAALPVFALGLLFLPG